MTEFDLSAVTEQFRADMPIADRWAYFDHAAVGPLPGCSAVAIQDWASQASLEGDTVWPSWSRAIEECRRLAAQLVNAQREEIALVNSTTAGIGLVAEGFPWRDGDNVVTLENEFPSNLYPWMHLSGRGVAIRRVKSDRGRVDLDRVADACDERTRIVAMSWVGYASGWRVSVSDVVDLAHRKGALMMLDAIQGLGVFPLDVAATGVDFFAADGHKWLLGPEGAGFFYCRREHLDRLRPIGVGWRSSSKPFDYLSTEQFELRQDAARYEGGTHNSCGFIGLGASLDLLLGLGLSAVESPLADRILELSRYARERLAEAGAEFPFLHEVGADSGIVTFTHPKLRPDQIRSACLAHQVVVSCRGGGVRLSVHAYNNEAEVDRLVQVLFDLVALQP